MFIALGVLSTLFFLAAFISTIIHAAHGDGLKASNQELIAAVWFCALVLCFK